MPEVICNTSPLQYLHQIDQLHILRPFGEKRGENFRSYTTQTNGLMTKAEIREFLEEHGLVGSCREVVVS